MYNYFHSLLFSMILHYVGHWSANSLWKCISYGPEFNPLQQSQGDFLRWQGFDDIAIRFNVLACILRVISSGLHKVSCSSVWLGQQNTIIGKKANTRVFQFWL